MRELVKSSDDTPEPDDYLEIDAWSSFACCRGIFFQAQQYNRQLI